jgi:hypothetical protein
MCKTVVTHQRLPTALQMLTFMQQEPAAQGCLLALLLLSNNAVRCHPVANRQLLLSLLL